MFETMDKLMLAGLGALSMTRERAEKIFDEYVNRGKAEKAGRSGFVQEMMDSAEKTRTAFEEVISKQVHHAVDKLNLANREDIKRVEEKLDQLLSRGQ
jgi:poly(hydroxyalkanoate) granule-associated protein